MTLLPDTANVLPPVAGAHPLRRLLYVFRMFFSALTERGECGVMQRQRYEAAIRQYSSMIDRICFGYAKSMADMEDLRQDALLNLWESMRLYKGDCSMKTWVYRLTLNTCVSSLRRSYRKVTTVQLSGLYDAVDCDADRRLMIRELHEAIGELNPIDKAIMLLWLEEETYDSIASITGVSRNNVAVRIHRAKEKLKTIIDR